MGQIGKAITTCIKRIEDAVKPGGALDGLHVLAAPIDERVNSNDLPMVRIYLPEMEEDRKQAHMAHMEIKIGFELQVDRREGFTNESERGFYDWMERIMDAMEHNEHGEHDSTLKGTLREPLNFTVDNLIPTNIAYAMGISANLRTKAYSRGQRR